MTQTASVREVLPTAGGRIVVEFPVDSFFVLDLQFTLLSADNPHWELLNNAMRAAAQAAAAYLNEHANKGK